MKAPIHKVLHSMWLVLHPAQLSKTRGNKREFKKKKKKGRQNGSWKETKMAHDTCSFTLDSKSGVYNLQLQRHM